MGTLGVRSRSDRFGTPLSNPWFEPSTAHSKTRWQRRVFSQAQGQLFAFTAPSGKIVERLSTAVFESRMGLLDALGYADSA